MYSGMFESTAIPVLEQVVQFTEARHAVLAGNIANMDTPGYKARDLSVEDFQAKLGEALQLQRQPVAALAQLDTEDFLTEGFTSPGDILEQSIITSSSAGEMKSDIPHPLLAETAKNTKSIMMHDESNVGMEYQVSEMVKNQMQHNMALNILVKQFQTLSTAISGRV